MFIIKKEKERERGRRENMLITNVPERRGSFNNFE